MLKQRKGRKATRVKKKHSSWEGLELSHVASVAGHSSDPLEETQERITEILGHSGTPEMLLSVFIHLKQNIYFQV